MQRGNLKMMIRAKRNLFVALLSLLLVGLSGCASLHDGEGIEHEPGESEIKHKH
mgnify:CR=1 FL=1